MKFYYKRYSANTLRPVIPVKLKSGEMSIGYEVLVDSGADICIFNYSIKHWGICQVSCLCPIPS